MIPNQIGETIGEEQIEAEAIPISPDTKVAETKDSKEVKDGREGSVTSKVTGKMVPMIAVKDKQVTGS